MVYVLDGDTPLFVMPTTNGNPNRPPPLGSFQVIEKIEHYCANTFGFWTKENSIVSGDSSQCPGPGYRYNEFPLDYWVSFYPGYGLHVGAVWDTSLDHGCLRLHEKAARDLYATVRTGTPVSVAETQPEDLTLGRRHPKHLDFSEDDLSGPSSSLGSHWVS